MKQRQIIAISLFITSIIMVLSSVMPHHHHGVITCFTVSHCSSEEAKQVCNHSHDSDPCKEECHVQLLFQTDFIKQHHHEGDCCLDIATNPLFPTLFILAGIDHTLASIQDSRRVFLTVYVERLHPITGNPSSAGRAPPVVIA